MKYLSKIDNTRFPKHPTYIISIEKEGDMYRAVISTYGKQYLLKGKSKYGYSNRETLMTEEECVKYGLIIGVKK